MNKLIFLFTRPIKNYSIIVLLISFFFSINSWFFWFINGSLLWIVLGLVILISLLSLILTIEEVFRILSITNFHNKFSLFLRSLLTIFLFLSSMHGLIYFLNNLIGSSLSDFIIPIVISAFLFAGSSIGLFQGQS